MAVTLRPGEVDGTLIHDGWRAALPVPATLGTEGLLLSTVDSWWKMLNAPTVAVHPGFPSKLAAGLRQVQRSDPNIPTPCLEWQGASMGSGYGNVRLQGGRNATTHVAAWVAVHGAVPAGLNLDHLCRNRRCAEISHLEPVTPWQNKLRGEGPVPPRAMAVFCGTCGSIPQPTTRGRRCTLCRRRRARASYRQQYLDPDYRDALNARRRQRRAAGRAVLR